MLTENTYTVFAAVIAFLLVLWVSHGSLDVAPPEQGGNRDIGNFQGGVVRFGPKHNNIIPVLADMIRWRIKLPSLKYN